MSVCFIDGATQPPYPGKPVHSSVDVEVPAGYTALVVTLLIPKNLVLADAQIPVAAEQAAVEVRAALEGQE